MEYRYIKFRAWSEQLQEMFFSTNNNGDVESREFHPFVFPIGTKKDWSFDNFKITQFTGLYDKNNKEIYEGDILAFDPYEWNRCSFKPYELWEYPQWLVEWDQEYGCWDTGGGTNSECKIYKKIIGNIFENPELYKYCK